MTNPTTPKLIITEMIASQSQPHLIFNLAIRILEAGLGQLTVLSRTTQEPTGSDDDGSCYIVPTDGTGEWADFPNYVALISEGVWYYFAPYIGMKAYVVDEDVDVSYSSSSPHAWTAGGTSGVILSVNVGSAVNNWNPTGWSGGQGVKEIRITPAGGGSSITGLDASDAVEGVYIRLMNDSTVDAITLPNNSGSSSAGNKWRGVAGGDMVIPPLGCLTITKDEVLNAWRFV